MSSIRIDEIDKRIAFLQNLVRQKEKKISKAPEGLLNVARAGNRIQYYFKNSSKDKQRKYLKKSQHSLIKSLCQKDYDERVIEVSKQELTHLKRLKKFYMKGNCEAIYEKIIPERREWIEPIELPDADFVEEWLRQDYQGKKFAPDAPEYYTDNGERVRSKSEILIANALKKYGIPYRYEAPLYLNEYGIIYPDFTVLNIKERKIYYFEHMGMMDDADYVEKALNRIKMYEKSGIYPGKKLILSHETSKCPMNTRDVESLIEKYLL